MNKNDKERMEYFRKEAEKDKIEEKLKMIKTIKEHRVDELLNLDVNLIADILILERGAFLKLIREYSKSYAFTHRNSKGCYRGDHYGYSKLIFNDKGELKCQD